MSVYVFPSSQLLSLRCRHFKYIFLFKVILGRLMPTHIHRNVLWVLYTSQIHTEIIHQERNGLRTQTGLGDTYEHCECEQTVQLPASAPLPAKMGQQWFSTHRMGIRMGTWCALELWAGGSAQLKLLLMKENRDFFFPLNTWTAHLWTPTCKHMSTHGALRVSTTGSIVTTGPVYQETKQSVKSTL